MTEKQKNLVVRAISGAIFVVIMVVGIAFRPIAMVFLFSLITGMTLWEYSRLVNEREDVYINRFISTAAGIYLFLAMACFCSSITPSAIFIPYLLTIVYLFISELYTKNPNAINDWAYTMLSQMYIALPFSMINVLAFTTGADGGVHYQAILPLSIFICLWVNDTGAYCSGSLFGKHKLFPRISPGKTWEGSIGGGIFVLVTTVIISYFDSKDPTSPQALTLMQWLGLGLVVVLFGTWGDLVESLFKRTLGIKDSGNILPGHGGMLDRFDSSLMAIPAAVIYLYTLSIFGAQ